MITEIYLFKKSVQSRVLSVPVKTKKGTKIQSEVLFNIISVRVDLRKSEQCRLKLILDNVFKSQET